MGSGFFFGGEGLKFWRGSRTQANAWLRHWCAGKYIS